MNPSSVTTARSRAERQKARQRRAMHQRTAALLILLAIAAATFAVAVETQATEPVAAPAEIAALSEAATEILAATEPSDIDTAPPQEVPATAYISDAIPLSHELQTVMWEECERWGCPYTLALAVAEVESQFNMAAMGAVGEVGIMQLNPGPGGTYHDELEAATGLNPTTPEGNISGGVYLLGSYMGMYNDPAMAAMAYNMGHGRASKAWAAGVTTSAHAEKVLAAMGRWEKIAETSEGERQ